MRHPDEGTIHAFLDGALLSSDARRFEEHVASCERCAAAVAEARGLIAASTRILGALDAVPAGVVAPGRATAGEQRRTLTGRRRWWRSPVVPAAAAAVLVVSIGFGVASRSSPVDRVAATDLAERGETRSETAAEFTPHREQDNASIAPLEQSAAEYGKAADGARVPAPAPSAPDPSVPAPATRVGRAAADAPREVLAGAAPVEPRAVEVTPPHEGERLRLLTVPDTNRLRTAASVAQAAKATVLDTDELPAAVPSALPGRVDAVKIERRGVERDGETDPLTADAITMADAPAATPPRAPAPAQAVAREPARVAPRAAAARAQDPRAPPAEGAVADSLPIELVVVSERVDTTLVGVVRSVVYMVRPGIEVTHRAIERRFGGAPAQRGRQADSSSTEEASERTLLRLDLGRVQAIHWSDASGVYHTLSGPVEQEELERIRSAIADKPREQR